jgi:hypothetical protein
MCDISSVKIFGRDYFENEVEKTGGRVKCFMSIDQVCELESTINLKKKKRFTKKNKKSGWEISGNILVVHFGDKQIPFVNNMYAEHKAFGIIEGNIWENVLVTPLKDEYVDRGFEHFMKFHKPSLVTF